MNGWLLSHDKTLNQWLAVELDKDYWIQRVVYMSRTICCGDGLDGMQVYVGNDFDSDQEALCGTYLGTFAKFGGQIGVVTCTSRVTGKVVRFRPLVNLSNSPGISRVAIFGVDISQL